MHVKSIIGSHGASFHEAYEANRLACLGKIHPVVSGVYSLNNAVEAVAKVKTNQHVGKMGVLCLAEQEGLGVINHELREQIGEEKISLFRNHVRQSELSKSA